MLMQEGGQGPASAMGLQAKPAVELWQKIRQYRSEEASFTGMYIAEGQGLRAFIGEVDIKRHGIFTVAGWTRPLAAGTGFRQFSSLNEG